MGEVKQERTAHASKAVYLLNCEIPFNPADAKAALGQLPRADAVFALFGADAHAEPYVGRTPNLRGRLERLLQPSEKHPKRLQLAGRVRRIAWRVTGSEFESLLTQFSLLMEIYGSKALERMHLRAPAFVRFLGSNPYPRVVVTNRPSQREADWVYGPFASRASAERFAEEMLKLFLLRRCVDELNPDPSHPGCVYSEMKMCLAPCYKGCTDERYAEESAAVERFLATRGESKLVTLKTQRDEASANLEFEQAAALHAQLQKVESVRGLAAELVRRVSQLRAVLLQASARPDEVAVFLFENGRLRGPAEFSTMGMRIQNEQSGSSSLWAQPMMLEPVVEEQGPEMQGTREQGNEGAEVQGPGTRDEGIEEQGLRDKETKAWNAGGGARQKVVRGALEGRLEGVIALLAQEASAPSATERQGHIALLKRWYYRPEAKRTGEICFPDAEGHWPIKSILRSIGRVAAKSMGAGRG
jgi:hypothetical protein